MIYETQREKELLESLCDAVLKAYGLKAKVGIDELLAAMKPKEEAPCPTT